MKQSRFRILQQYSFLKKLLKNPLSFLGLCSVMLMVIIALLAPVIAPYPSHAGSVTNYKAIMLPPNWSYLCGTDYLGRDIFSRVIMGSRISLLIGTATMLLSLVVGTTVGLIAGYFGRALDELLMRLAEIFLAFPTLVLAILISSLWGRGLVNIMIAVSFVWWPKYARLVRGLALSIRGNEFIEAARSMGASAGRIMIHHLLPNMIAGLGVQATLDIGYMILVAAALGFVGSGAQPPSPEWGLMVSIGRNYMPTYWWMSVFPGLAILVTVLGFNLLGDGLRDILDPRTSRRGK